MKEKVHYDVVSTLIPERRNKRWFSFVCLTLTQCPVHRLRQLSNLGVLSKPKLVVLVGYVFIYLLCIKSIKKIGRVG